MDFTKLRDGVVAFSAFVVGHAFWLWITIYSLWLAFGTRFETVASGVGDSAIAFSQNETTKAVLTTYGIQPLMPAFALFLIIFGLHAHRQLLDWLGSFVPPELVEYNMPGLRDIDSGRWMWVLRKLGPKVSLADLQILVEARYPAFIKRRRFFRLGQTFNILKSVALLNAALCAVASNKVGRIGNLWMCIAALLAAAATVLLHIYHTRNNSHWAIDDILQTIVAENVGKEASENKEEASSAIDRKQVEQFCSAERETRPFTLSWSLPLIGNLLILKESWARRRQDAREKIRG
jgi:hypothetical protein